MAKQTVKQSDAPRSMTMSTGREDQEKLIQQPDESEYKGRYRHKKDGYLYKHCIKDHALGKTHKAIVPAQYEEVEGVKTCIHTGLFWEGTQEDFEATFSKE